MEASGGCSRKINFRHVNCNVVGVLYAQTDQKNNCDGVGVSMKTRVTLLCCTHEHKTKTKLFVTWEMCRKKTSHTNHAVCTIKCTPCDEGVGASKRTSRTVRAVCTMRTKSVRHVGGASQKTSHIDSAVCTINCSTRVRGCSGVVDLSTAHLSVMIGLTTSFTLSTLGRAGRQGFTPRF
jgi:hypothetical protein